MRYFHAVFVRKSASDQGMAWSGRRYHPCSMCDEACSQSSSDAIDGLSHDTATNNLIPDQHTLSEKIKHKNSLWSIEVRIVQDFNLLIFHSYFYQSYIHKNLACARKIFPKTCILSRLDFCYSSRLLYAYNLL
jgi:hypothetical protein